MCLGRNLITPLSLEGTMQQDISNPRGSQRALTINIPMRRGTPLYFFLTNKGELLRNVKVKGNIGCSDSEMMEIKILTEV